MTDKKHQSIRKQYVPGCAHFTEPVPGNHHNKLRAHEAMEWEEHFDWLTVVKTKSRCDTTVNRIKCIQIISNCPYVLCAVIY